MYIYLRFSVYSFPSNISGYKKGNKVLIDTIYNTFPGLTSSLEAEDEILFFTKKDKSVINIARIAATAGDTVEIKVLKDKKYFAINGIIQKDLPLPSENTNNILLGLVPEGSFFVLQDEIGSTRNTFDSRDFGFVDKANIYAKIIMNWSGDSDDNLAPGSNE